MCAENIGKELTCEINERGVKLAHHIPGGLFMANHRSVRRAAAKRAVARRAVKRAVARRIVRRAVARRALRRAVGRRALKKAAARKLAAAQIRRMSLEY